MTLSSLPKIVLALAVLHATRRIDIAIEMRRYKQEVAARLKASQVETSGGAEGGLSRAVGGVGSQAAAMGEEWKSKERAQQTLAARGENTAVCTLFTPSNDYVRALKTLLEQFRPYILGFPIGALLTFCSILYN